MPIPLQPSTTILQLLASTYSEPKMTPTEDLGQTDHVNTLSNHSVLSSAATAWSSLTALLQNATSLPPFSLQVEHTLTPYVNCDVTMETYCNFFTGRMLFLTPNQQCQSTEDNKAQRGADIKTFICRQQL